MVPIVTKLGTEVTHQKRVPPMKSQDISMALPDHVTSCNYCISTTIMTMVAKISMMVT